MFTDRETEVLELLTEGLCNEEIAEKLSVARSTIKKHLESIYEKMDVHNRAQACVKYIKMKHNITIE